jgi:hypothetical protein
MKNTFRNVFAMAIALTLSLLLAWGCDGGAQERAVFAQNMTDPTERFTASTRGTEKEILVLQIPGRALSHPENLFQGERLRQLRSRGFKRVEIRGSDGQMIWEQNLD